MKQVETHDPPQRHFDLHVCRLKNVRRAWWIRYGLPVGFFIAFLAAEGTFVGLGWVGR